MNETRSRDHKGGWDFSRLYSRGGLLWDGLFRNVRSSLTFAVKFESSVALVCLYGLGGFGLASMLGG